MRLNRFGMDLFILGLFLEFKSNISFTMSVRIQDINRLLGIQSPWEVSEIKQDDATQLAEIHVICSVLQCPECNKVCPGYDHRLRKWRHTDICEYQTTVVAKVPRVECSEHGIKTVSVP